MKLTPSRPKCRCRRSGRRELSERDDQQRGDLAVHVDKVLRREKIGRPGTASRMNIRTVGRADTSPSPERPKPPNAMRAHAAALPRRGGSPSACVMIDSSVAPSRSISETMRALAHDEDPIAKSKMLGELAGRDQDGAALVRKIAQQRDRFRPWRPHRRRASAPRSPACRRLMRATRPIMIFCWLPPESEETS